MAGISWERIRLGRLVRWAGALSAAALASWVFWPWIPLLLPRAAITNVTIGFLTSLGVAYGLVMMTALGGVPVLSVILYRARRRGTSRPIVARWLLLLGCCLLGLVVAEATAAAWQSAKHRVPSLSNGEPLLPARFVDSGGESEVTLVVVGESSAEGLPFESWFSVGTVVAWELGRAIPARRFRTEIVAKRADTLADQYQKLAGLGHHPDAVIVYCGHNEFDARIPWSRRPNHYRDEQAAPILWGLDEVAARVSPFCGLICETINKYRVGQHPPTGLHPPLIDVPGYTPAEFAGILADFGRRLDAIVAYCERMGAIPILVIPPSNDTGFDPNRSFLPESTPRAERESFARQFLAVRSLEDSEPAKAIATYQALLAQQPGFAETHHRLARLLERAGAWDEAYRHYVAARDLDGLPLRCLTPFQEAYREVAARHDCLLIDGQALFHETRPHGLLDDHLFHDGMHPSLRGHLTLAQAILDALYQKRAFGWAADAPPPAIDPARCAAHFGLKPEGWKLVCERGYMFYYATKALRYDPSHRIAIERAFGQAAARIAAGEPPEAVGLPNIGIPAAAPARW